MQVCHVSCIATPPLPYPFAVADVVVVVSVGKNLVGFLTFADFSGSRHKYEIVVRIVLHADCELAC